MKASRCGLIGFMVSILCSAQMPTAQTTSYPIRAALCGQDLPANLLHRLKAAGYTHLLVPIGIVANEWENGLYNLTQYPDSGQAAVLTRVFLRAHDYGLKVIPMLPSANMWSTQWFNARNPQITYEPIFNGLIEGQVMNSAVSDNGLLNFISKFIDISKSESEISVSAVASYADDSSGYSTSFQSLVNDIVAAAFENSGLPDSEFTYIHLSNDEPVEYSPSVERKNKFLVGKSQEDLRWIYQNDPINHHGVSAIAVDTATDCFGPFPTCLPEMVAAKMYLRALATRIQDGRRIRTYPDTLYTRTELGDNLDSAYVDGVQELYADFVARRVQEVKRFLPNVKAIIYADMFDPQHTGGYLESAGSLAKLSRRTISLTTGDDSIQKHLVLMPWLYPNTYTHPLESAIDDAQINTHNVPIAVRLSVGWLACKAIPTPLLRLGCYALTAKYTSDYALEALDADVSLKYEATGQRYDADSAISFFIRNGFQFMYMQAFEKGEPLAHTLFQIFKVIEAPNKLPQSDRDGYCVGFAHASFEESQRWSSADTNNLYDQFVQHNNIELLSAVALAKHATNTSMFSNDLLYRAAGNTFVSRSPVQNIDYLVVNRNMLDPHFNRVYGLRDSVGFYDAVMFCNNLSKREGLDTVYSYRSAEFSRSFDPGRPMVITMGGLSAHFSRTGYRLPTFGELRVLHGDTAIDEDSSGREWVWLGDSLHHFVAFDHGNTDTASADSVGAANILFRVIRRNPTIPGISVLVKDQTEAIRRITTPWFYIKNSSTQALRNFSVYYYFTTEAGKRPVLERLWTPKFTVSIEHIIGDQYRIRYDYAGSIAPDSSDAPTRNGAIVALHYPDFSTWVKTNDYSWPNTQRFAESNRIVIVDDAGVVIYGNLPPAP